MLAMAPHGKGIGEDEINIPLVYEQTTETPVVRTLTDIPIEAFYCSSQNVIHLNYRWPLENMSIRITNLITNQYIVYSEYLDIITEIPIAFGPGLYHIEISFEDGGEAHGYFTVNQ